MRIIIVDDDSQRANEIAMALSKAKICDIEQVDISYNTQSARKRMSVTCYDILILDVILPKRNELPTAKNGLAFLKEITHRSQLENEKRRIYKPGFIIGITADADDIISYREEFNSFCFSIIEATYKNIGWKSTLINAIQYQQSSKINSDVSNIKKVCVTVHGIESLGLWQQKFKKLISSHTGDVSFETYKYGVFSAFFFLTTITRFYEVNRFKRALREILKNHSDKEVYVFCHSFGTFITVKAIEKLSSEELKKIKYIVLAGSVLKSSYNFSPILEKSSAVIVNECGSNDIPLLLSESIVPRTGMAGRIGFKGSNNDRFVNRFFVGGHSHYFKNDDEFMRLYWLPLFEASYSPQLIDKRKDDSWSNLINTMCRMVGLIKDPLYIVALLYMLFIFITRVIDL
ncbi:alpha/beta hydrolase [Aeromonas veronii]|uniref:alpha/beta hydrolase n=1 Tax=Aeromonas veronii TaxID=654 RepID=UPI0036716855